MMIKKQLAFTPDEYQGRIRRIRKTMADKGIDTLMLHTPENICYASGYHTPGYYFVQVFVIPAAKDPFLVTRRLELGNAYAYAWIPDDQAIGYLDTDNPADIIASEMKKRGLDKGRIGVEMSGYSFLSFERFDQMKAALKAATIVNGSGIVEQERAVKSPKEIEYIRKACHIADVGMKVAVEKARVGMTENTLAAHIHMAMVELGSEYPGLPLFLSSGHRTYVTHATWTDKVLEKGDNVLVEHAGVVQRYAGPIFRTLSMGKPSNQFANNAKICADVLNAAIAALKPGATSGDVNEAAVGAARKAGLDAGIRKRAGYSVGLNFPPDWGEGVFLDLKAGDKTVLKPGMVFHVPQSLRRGDDLPCAISETILVTEKGPEVLTKYQPRDLIVID